MDSKKRQKLEAAEWQVGTVEDFLELSPAETQIIVLKSALSRQFKVFREKWTID